MIAYDKTYHSLEYNIIITIIVILMISLLPFSLTARRPCRLERATLSSRLAVSRSYSGNHNNNSNDSNTYNDI